MTVTPAQVGGVERIVVCSPKPARETMAAAALAGVTEFYRVGGAQAIAAMAYGTPTVARVDKIVGPGNLFVTAAKVLVSEDCGIDMPAGPTEIVVTSGNGDAEGIAADLVAQAEHDPDAVALLVTTSRTLATEVRDAVGERLSALPPTNLARQSLSRNGAILIARNTASAVRFANAFAPEHLSIPGGETALVKGLRTAGSFFVGPWSAQSIGDYASGTNHVLPTGGGARSRGGLSTWDFVRCATVQQLSRGGLRSLAPVVAELADAEGLAAHKSAVEVRL
jgi:histidinol dehydrogenase